MSLLPELKILRKVSNKKTKKLESIFKHLASCTTQSFIEDVTEDLLPQIFVNPSVGVHCDAFKFIVNSENGPEKSIVEVEPIYYESYNIHYFWCTWRAKQMKDTRKHKQKHQSFRLFHYL